MENTNKTKKLFSFLISPLILAVTVIGVNFSGNDKAPFLIFFAFGIIALIFVISGIKNLVGNWVSSNSKSLFFGATFALIYVIAIVFLSRAGLVDSNTFLGFR